MITSRYTFFTILVGLTLCGSLGSRAATPGLPFTEDFSNTALQDTARSTAQWDTLHGTMGLARRRPGYADYAAMQGTNVSTHPANTQGIAVGDLNGDGHLDVIVVNLDGYARAHHGSGSPGPFTNSVISRIPDTHSTPLRAVVLGDVDGDGDLDLVVGRDAKANRLYLNNGTITPFKDVSFSTISDDEYRSYGLALGDVDGDADLDLIVANAGETNRLYLNNGTKAPFGDSVGIAISGTTNDTRAVSLGDMNADGHPDLVFGNHGEPNQVVLNNGTAIPFSGATPHEMGTNACDTLCLALGDVDGDGDLDVVAGNRSTSTGAVDMVYMNKGGGNNFVCVPLTDDAFQTYDVRVTDLDGDGHLDIITANGDAARVYPGRNRETSPDPYANTTGQTLGTNTVECRAVCTADFDGDGKADVVCGTMAQTRFYPNNATDSPLHPVVATPCTTDATTTRALAVGDMDGDGDTDLVTAEYGTPNRLYLSDGSSTPLAGSIGTNVTDDSHYTQAIAVGDVDGDGDLDVVAGNRDQFNCLYLNNGTATPFAGVSNSKISTDDHKTWAIALGDMDRDGDLDVIVGNAGGQTNRLYLNNGTPTPFAGVTGVNITDDGYTTRGLTIADINADGHLDVVAINNDQCNRLYLNNGSATPFAGVSGLDISTDTHGSQSAAVGDVDGDGSLDIVVANEGAKEWLYLNNGTPTPFAPVTAMALPGTARASYTIALADLDRDGDLDVVTGSANDCRFSLNNGSSLFNGAGTHMLAEAGEEVRGLAVADFDRDGSPDIMAGHLNGTNRLYLSRAGLCPAYGWVDDRLGLPLNLRGEEVALGDFDADGDLDLVYATEDGGFLIENNGTETPTQEAVPTPVGNSTNMEPTVCAVGDLNGNGRIDVVLSGYDQPGRLFLNNGTSSPLIGVEGIEFGTGAARAYDLELGDMDGDGDLDIVVARYSNNDPNKLYLNNGTTNPFLGVAAITIGSETNYSTGLNLADLNGDGHLDVLVCGWDKPLRLYVNNGTTNPFSGVASVDFSADASFTYGLSTGDVDGDGDLDIIEAVSPTGPWLHVNDGSATPFQGSCSHRIVSNDCYAVSPVLADMDHDGDLDLALGMHNQPSALYFNDGSATPFSVTRRSPLLEEELSARSMVAGDLDGDGLLDLAVAGDYADWANRVSLRRVYDITRGTTVSLTTDTEPGSLYDITLTASSSVPVHATCAYALSNDGGTTWVGSTPGLLQSFPRAASDLRWRVACRSLSPVQSPQLTTVMLDLSALYGATHYVDAGNATPLPPYTNGWASAATSIVDAVALAVGGGHILVTNGLYQLNGEVVVTKAIDIRSMRGAGETTVRGNDSNRCFRITHADAVLDGFRVTNGRTGQMGGGGVRLRDGATLLNSIIDHNYGGFGGGVVIVEGSTVSHCIITNNTGGGGGGLGIKQGGLAVNCLITGNTAENYGGGILIEGGGTVRCSTICDNTAKYNGGTTTEGGGTFENCIVAHNGDDNVGSFGGGMLPVYDHCCIVPAVSGTGMVDDLPRFVNRAVGDYRLAIDSPCIDTGKDVTGLVTDDLLGDNRPIDGNADGTNAFDIGAFEYNALTTDSDADQLCDADELTLTGTSPTNSNTDGDPASDYEEYIADTGGADSNDYFRITAISNDSPVTICFTSSATRTYTLLSCSNLLTGTWTNVPGAGPRWGEGGADALQDTNAPLRGPHYRIKVTLPE